MERPESLSTLASYINIDFADPTRAEVGCIDDTHFWAMFAHVPDGTRLYIKMDLTEWDQFAMLDW